MMTLEWRTLFEKRQLVKHEHHLIMFNPHNNYTFPKCILPRVPFTVQHELYSTHPVHGDHGEVVGGLLLMVQG